LQITGDLTLALPADGYRSKLSDAINNSRHFIVLTDVAVQRGRRLITKMPFLCINKPAIALLYEADNADSSKHQGEQIASL
jgi:hypothetical protein